MENPVKFEARELLYQSLVKDLNLQKLTENYYPSTMGNYVITFSSDDFLLQYANDRNDLLLNIASTLSPDNWLNLTFLENYINEAAELNPEAQAFNLENILRQNAFIKDNCHEIARLLNEDNYQNTYHQIEGIVKRENVRRYRVIAKRR